MYDPYRNVKTYMKVFLH